MARHGAGAVIGSGAVVGFVALALASTSTSTGTPGQGAGGMRLRAVFPSSDGLDPGDAVVLAGIPVGRILSVRLDRATFLSDVDLELASSLALPSDTQFAIRAGGTGDGVLEIEPGHAATHLSAGAVVTATIPAESLEQQVGNYIFGSGGLGED